jgi:myo-inositol-1(or 4)-monophosphatase
MPVNQRRKIVHSAEWEPAFEVLRRVGATLKQQFARITPVIEGEAIIATFRKIDDETTETIRAGLTQAYPAIEWKEGELAGAQGWQQANEGSYWVCDAIDGAVQYLRAIPQWCISLTLVRDGEPVFAAIFDPMHEDLFHAVADAGAFLNGNPIRVNGQRSHVAAFLATSQPPFVNDDLGAITLAGRSLTVALADAGAVRNLGPTSLQIAYVACGRLDAFWEFGEDTFNCLGAVLMVREAGGHATEIDGQPYRLQSGSLLAGTPGVHASLLEKLATL